MEEQFPEHAGVAPREGGQGVRTASPRTPRAQEHERKINWQDLHASRSKQNECDADARARVPCPSSLPQAPQLGRATRQQRGVCWSSYPKHWKPFSKPSVVVVSHPSRPLHAAPQHRTELRLLSALVSHPRETNSTPPLLTHTEMSLSCRHLWPQQITRGGPAPASLPQRRHHPHPRRCAGPSGTRPGSPRSPPRHAAAPRPPRPRPSRPRP